MRPRTTAATPRNAALTAKRLNLRARLAATLRADRQRLLLKLADAAAAGSKAPRQRR